jgi:anthranilate synthase / indole-3-glycerol phosphate synthase / phosphoribosylanthranilate isomerase
MSSAETTAATSNPRDRTPYTPQQLKDALDSLMRLVDSTADASSPDTDADANADRDKEEALDDDAAHIFGHGDADHRLSMLQVITATRILDYRQREQAETTKQSSTWGVGNGNSPSSFSTTRETPDLLNLQDVIRSQSPRMALAAEFKRASPSKGQIATTEATNNAGEQARRYATSGACIVSVLTEPRWFQGSLHDLEQVRAATSNLPSRDGSSSSSQRPAILRKDFCISEEMIDEAVQSGADTVLLIVAVLPRRLLQSLIDHCRKVGMEPLVEVHTDHELRVAVHCGARVIGVNNRNLHTFHLDMNTSTRIARTLDEIVKQQQPPLSRKDFTLCALSGMSTADDVDLYRKSGIDMCLIGESLMRSPNPSQLIADLCLDPADYQKRKNENQPAKVNGAANEATSISQASAPPYVDGLKLVKVCGITTAHDAVAACQAGASLIGIIFAERSPRKVATNQQAIEIVRAVRQFGEREKRLDFGTFDDASRNPLDALTAKAHALASATRRTPGVVGVFQNQDLEWIRSVADECGLDLIQLHGQEGMKAANASNFGGVPALRVVDIPVDDTDPPSNGNGSSNIVDEANPTGVETKLLQSITSDPIAILLDTSIKGRGAGGGTGKSFDWTVAARLQLAGLPVIVAGGLSPDTVSECCSTIRPLGVDVSSGVESSPGVKDHEKVTRFVHAARQAA